jgi:RHS repeat-associated protein
MQDARGATAYAYDALDQLIEVTHPDGKVRYGYDKVGNRTSLTYPDDVTAAYGYDELNRLAQVNGLGGQTRYQYDAASNLVRISYPNQTNISYRYDKADRLVEVANRTDDDTLARFSYSLDELGNRTAVRASGSAVSERVISYTYDELSQLIGEDERRAGGPVTRKEYTYDAAGNRLTQRRLLPGDDDRAEVVPYRYDDADRLLQAGDLTFTYDANGNRRTETVPGKYRIDYGYDAANRLIRVVRSGKTIEYAYDGDGNKVEEVVSAGSRRSRTLRFLNDVATPLPVVLQQDDAQMGQPEEKTRYLHGLGLLSEELVGPGRQPQQFFYHSDGLGSTVALTDRNGRTRAEYQYDAWGNVERRSGKVPNRFLFTGEEQDPETGLQYLRARWYDPRVGIFLTKDPFPGVAALPRSLHPYMYVFNNPANLVDPAGVWGWPKVTKAFVNVVTTAVQTAASRGQAVAIAAASAAPKVGIVAAKLAITSAVCANSAEACGIGLTLGVAGWLLDPDAEIHLGWGAVEFTNNPVLERIRGDSPAGITFGAVVLYPGEPFHRTHEFSHVGQSVVLGEWYLPAHIATGGYSELRCRAWHRCNPLEKPPLAAPERLTVDRK